MNRFLDNCKSLQKGQNRAKKGKKNADFRLFFYIFYIFGPFLLILNQKKNSKFQKQNWENLTNFTNWAQKILIFAYFGPKNNCMVKMTTPYPGHYCALSSCKILGNNNEPFFR